MAREKGVPKGWRVADHENSDGSITKCYINDLGQKFFDKEGLLRYVAYAKANGLSIYAPDYKATKGRRTRSRKPRRKSRRLAGLPPEKAKGVK